MSRIVIWIALQQIQYSPLIFHGSMELEREFVVVFLDFDSVVVFLEFDSVVAFLYSI